MDKCGLYYNYDNVLVSNISKITGFGQGMTTTADTKLAQHGSLCGEWTPMELLLAIYPLQSPFVISLSKIPYWELLQCRIQTHPHTTSPCYKKKTRYQHRPLYNIFMFSAKTNL